MGYTLRLYLRSPGHSDPALGTIHAILAALSERGTDAGLEIIDVDQSPDQALDDRVVVTPALVRMSPPPRRTVIGDLTDVRSVVAVLA